MESDLARKIPIVLAAFGSTVPEARQTYDRFESAARKRFPLHPIAWGYTSSIVRRMLLSEGKEVRSPIEALEALRAQGHARAVVQSLHVTPGEEYSRLIETRVEGMTLTFGLPLLSSEEKQDRLLDILASEPREDCPTVFVGHGNEKRPEFNETGMALAAKVRVRFANTVLATLEGTPGPGAMEEIRGRATETGRVHFVPLLFVAGDHVRRDLMGPSAESWRSILGAREVSCSITLGERAEVVQMYLDQLEEAVRMAGE